MGRIPASLTDTAEKSVLYCAIPPKGPALVARPTPARFDPAPAIGIAIASLLDQLDFSAGKRNWGYQFRFGLFSISDHDLKIIAAAMKAKLSE